MNVRIICVCFAVITFAALPTRDLAAATYTDMVVFGDSYTDTGNLYDSTGGAVDPPPYFEGRASNGPVWVEYLASELGLPAPVASRLGGKNYAYGGAQTGAGNSSVNGVPNVGTQIAEFLSSGATLTENHLVVLWAGLNDRSVGIDSEVVAANLVDHISTLHAAGAENFLVGNFYPVPPWDGPNSLLARDTEALSESLSIFIAPLDFAGLWQEIAGNPSAFGFTNISSPAFDAATSTVVPNPDEYAFWDSTHPTTAFHRIIAQRAALDPEDFDADGRLDQGDINLLCTTISRGRFERKLDLDKNKTVDAADVSLFLSAAGSLPGDVDLNGSVDFADFTVLADAFGKRTSQARWSRGDFDCNRTIDFADFLVLASNFGKSADGYTAPVPEPTGSGLAMLMLLVAMEVSRRRAVNIAQSRTTFAKN